MAFPDWLLPSILLFPALVWMFFGVGIPWALAILPRADWRDRLTVIGVGIALGPAFTTAAMFLIGTFGQFTATNVILSSVIVAVLGGVVAWRRQIATKQAGSKPAPTGRTDPFGPVEMALIGVIAIAVILRFWNTAYWPYTTYDEFWVYGYNAKIFMLQRAIPPTMGYYPQLIPLAYTFMQLLWGGLNDHAARTVVPFFAMGSIVMAYLLGAQSFNRRVGLLTAAIWALYPQHAIWSQFGDLEVPVTLYFTGTSAFLIAGWREQNRRYFILGGLLLGAALWTKPTAGALIESLILIIAVTTIRFLSGEPPSRKRMVEKVRELAHQPLPRYTLLTLIVGLPMGGMWYIRNVLYGLPPLVFPAGYWQQAAQRSGQEFGWPILIAIAGTAILLIRRCRARVALAGLGFILVGSLPSAFGWQLPTFGELSQMAVGQIPAITPTHLTLWEYLLIGAGAALLIWAAIPLWRELSSQRRGVVLLVCAFIAPYFVTWFWSYSYHFRLSFAIVPLMVVLLAASLHSLFMALKPMIRPSRLMAVGACFAIVILALPGWFATLTALEPAITRSLANDHDKMARGNPALLGLVDYLEAHHPAGRPMRVEASGELRLPFFFPQDDIRTVDYPQWLDQIADVDFLIDSSVGQRLYREIGKEYNQILASLTRDPVMHRVYTVDDKNFRFSVYTVDNLTRFQVPAPNALLGVQVGDFAYLYGTEMSRLENYGGTTLFLTLWWKAIKPADIDYSVFIHLWDPRQQKLIEAWGGEPVTGAFSVWQNVSGEHFSVAYHTRLWQPGETIKDEWKIEIPNAPPGVYELRIGLYDAVTGVRLPVTQNGLAFGDGYGVRMHDFTILPTPSQP